MTHLLIPAPLIDANWLRHQLNHPDLVVLSVYLPPLVGKSIEPRSADGVPGSRLFDVEKMSDPSSLLPHMMPSAEAFEAAIRKLGISNQSAVVVYDDKGIYSSARARYMFRAMGFENIAVLNGGLPAWKQIGGETTELKEYSRESGDFSASPRPEFFVTAEEVEGFRRDPEYHIFDARSRGRFYGTTPEPRQNLRAGHIPGSLNLPFPEVLQKSGEMKSTADLVALFKRRTSPVQKLVFSCGSGVTACISALGAEMAGLENIAIYDGSWSEWGADLSRPVATEDIEIEEN